MSANTGTKGISICVNKSDNLFSFSSLSKIG